MTIKLRYLVAALTAVLILGLVGGHEWARRAPGQSAISPAGAETTSRKVLYWYDPMEPGQHFDKPGKSPFMDMQMVPRYADDGEAESTGIRLDPRLAQNLGVRLATAERGEIAQSLDVPGTFVFNERLTATIQTRTAGFVSRTHSRALGDVVARDAPLVDLLVPDWAAAETEYLALLRSGDGALAAAARQRLVLLGLPESLIAKVERNKQVYPEFTVVAPIAGVIDALEVRAGMTVGAGATVARIQGLDPIWIDAAVPEAQGALTTLGKSAMIRCTAYPGVTFRGRIVSVLPQTNADSHTLRVRVEVDNHEARLKPGMFAQVQLAAGDPQQGLLVPTEAVIHTGTRDLVIVASGANRFEPVEVRVGGEYGTRTRIVAGLEAGQQVVASGQFLIESEASLRGIEARMNPARGVSHSTGQGSVKP